MIPAVTLLLVLVAQGQAQVSAAPQAGDPLLTPPPAAQRQLASFAEAVRAVRAGSDTLEIAAARAGAAAARARQALALLLPNVQGSAGVYYDLLNPDRPPAMATGGAGTTDTRDGAPTTPLGVGQVTFQVPLVNVQLWQARATTRATADAEGATRTDVVRVVVGGLGGAMIDVLAAERAAALQRDGLRQALERQSLVQRTLDLGSGTRLDLVRAQQDTRLARADVVVGREQVAQLREALGLFVGAEGPVGVAPALELESLLDGARRACPAVPLPDRPDVLALRLRLRASEELVDQARAEYIPSLHLQSTITALTVEAGPLRVPSWTVAAVLSVPLWDGGGRGARVAERGWLARAADRELRLATREVTVEQARAERGVTVARELLAEATAGRDLAREADRMTRRSFETGAATSFELVQSAQALRQAELILATREFALAGARLTALIAGATCSID